MKTGTKIKVFLTLAALLLGLGVLRGFVPFPGIDTQPLTARVSPSTSDGRFMTVRGTWEGGTAFITITAGNGIDPPNCKTGKCAPSPYTQKIQVTHGQEVIFSVQADSYKGRATCLLLAPGESFGSRIPATARQEGTGNDGHVTCTRTVTW